jgi:hypothetical protein
MLDVIQVDGPVVAFRAAGTLTAEDYDRMTAEIDRQLSEHERVALFADMTGLHGMSLDALARDLRYSTGKLGELGRIDRVAVVTEKGWLRAWTRLAWMLVPRSTVRTFESSERDAALAWTAELQPEPARHALRWIETTRPNVFAFDWNGTVTNEDVDQVLTKLESALDVHNSVSLLSRIQHVGGIRPSALFHRGTYLRVKVLGLKKIERYALVTSSPFLARYVDLMKHLTNIDVRLFSPEREGEAWAWLDAQEATSSSDQTLPRSSAQN